MSSELSLVARACPVATFADLSEPQNVQHHEMYNADALRPQPWLDVTDIPIRIDHIKDAEPIGYVTALRTDNDAFGGTWVFIHAKITDPPGWLRRGTPVSISYSPFQTRTPWGGEWPLVQKAFLNELSVLSPGQKPAHPGARVDWVGELNRSPAAPTTSSRPAAGEVFHDDFGKRLIRPNSGYVIEVR